MMLCLMLAILSVAISDLASWAAGHRFKMISAPCYICMSAAIYIFNIFRWPLMIVITWHSLLFSDLLEEATRMTFSRITSLTRALNVALWDPPENHPATSPMTPSQDRIRLFPRSRKKLALSEFKTWQSTKWESPLKNCPYVGLWHASCIFIIHQLAPIWSSYCLLVVLW